MSCPVGVLIRGGVGTSAGKPCAAGRLPRALGAAILLGVASLLPQCALAQSPFRLWLIMDESSARRGPAQDTPELDKFLAEWKQQGIDLYAIREKARLEPEFARALPGQEPVLRMLAAFRKDTGLPAEIEVKFFTWEEYWASLEAAVASPSQRPDLFQVPSTWCGSLAKDERVRLLVPLPQDLAQQAGDLYNRKLLGACRPQGDNALYGLPWLLDIRLFYFWRDSLPGFERNLRNAPSARDAFEQTLRAAAANKAIPLFALPAARHTDLVNQWAVLVWGQGGDLVSVTNWGPWQVKSPVFQEAGELSALYMKRLVQENLAELPRVTPTELEAAFLNHQLGSMIAGPTLIPRLRERLGEGWDTQVGLVMPPVGEKQEATFLGGSLLGISTAAREDGQFQAAEALAEYLTSGPGALPSALGAGFLPGSNQALGTAEEALAPIAAHAPGGPPKTYLEYVATITSDDRVTRLIEDALKKGRTYPSIPEWATQLEVPSTLTGLYHLWQDVAAGEADSVLRADVQSLAQEWDAALSWFPPWLLWPLLLLALLAVAAIFGVYRLRVKQAEVKRRLGELTVREQATLGLQERIEEALNATSESQSHIHAVTSEAQVREALKIENTLREVSDHLQETRDEIRNERQSVERVLGILAPQPRSEARLQIVLPAGEGKLKIIFDGKEAELTGKPCRILDFVVREFLLEGHRDFSPLHAHLLLWTDRIPHDPSRAFWGEVSAIRNAFERVGLRKEEVVPRGKREVYRLNLRRKDFDCHVVLENEALSFTKLVGDRHQEATELLWNGNALGALEKGLEAYRSEAELQAKDAQILTLLCRIRQSIEPNSIPPERQRMLDQAQEELRHNFRRYQSVLAENSAREAFSRLQLEYSDDLEMQWKRFRRQLGKMESVLGPVVEQSLGPPLEFAEEWNVAKDWIVALRRLEPGANWQAWWPGQEGDPVKSLLDELVACWFPSLALGPEQTARVAEILWNALVSSPKPRNRDTVRTMEEYFLAELQRRAKSAASGAARAV
jgi:ABC-type glycerol-3-phosphate transport system substrate-binding protein